MPELDRRNFLKMVGLSAGAVAAAGCQEPVERVIPYLIQPEEVTPGIATYYASTCRECPAACGTRVKTREGRPIKVDGNPEDPISRGALCVRGQTSLDRTYDAARFRGPVRREGDRWVSASWEEGLGLLVQRLRGTAAAGRVAFLGGHETGTLDGLIDRFLAAIGSRHRVRFELYGYEALRKADEIVFGTDTVPHFDLERADFVLSFGADFLETWLNPLQNQRGYSEGRRAGQGYAVYVGPRLSLSGSNADLWIAPEPGTEIFVARGLARELASRRGTRSLPASARRVLEPFSLAKAAELSGVEQRTLEVVAGRLAKAKAPLSLPPGSEILGTNGTELAVAVQLLNAASGALGNTVRFGPDHNLSGLGSLGDLKDLAGRMRGGEVEVLLIHDTNPVYALPSAFGFADAVRQVPFKVSFSSADDETTSMADLVLPDHTPFEAWGDSEPIMGVRRLQQPTIRPIFDTRAL
ncbi:MAG: molybdopterin-dependent oxidoreductase, partial [Myxococcota bacterium]